jgi:glycosyl transferase family 61
MQVEIVGPETINISCADVQSFTSMAEPICGGPEILSDQYSNYRWNRNGRAVDGFRLVETKRETWDADCSYFGPLILHFGHFMAEGVHRFLNSPPQMKRGHWVLVGSPTLGIKEFNDLPAWFRDTLSYLGIFSDQVSLLSKDVSIKNLSVTAQSAQLGLAPSDSYVESLRDLANQRFWGPTPTNKSGKKIYVSRSALVGQGNILGERYLESVLQEEGYCVIRPETMSFRAQLEAYVTADIIIFPEGSAIHGVELLGNNLNTVAVLCRRPDSRHSFESVLGKRAKNVLFLENPFEIGTVDVHPGNGRLLTERSQAFFSHDAISRFFRDNSLGSLKLFDDGRYNNASLDDLGRYVNTSLQRGDVAHVSEADVRKLFIKLEEFVSTFR